MAIHARSDVAAVTISPEHGGCGEIHSRPVVNGAPVKLWSLSCGQCETHLRQTNHPHWSATLSGIPETPDEQAYREDREKKGMADQQQQTADAIAKLASLGDLPAAIARLAEMFNSEPKREQQTKGCTKCDNSSPYNAKFCTHCGNRFTEAPVGHLPDLEEMSDTQLRLLAQEKGIRVHPRAGRAKILETLDALGG
jgi:hypothetical protein